MLVSPPVSSAASLLAAALCAAAGLSACADPVETLLIVQNQVPILDESGTRCLITAESTAVSLSSGVLDVDLDQPYPYIVYPLVQNRLPSIMTTRGVERNSVFLRRINVTIRPPAGLNVQWPAGCPGSFSAPASGQMDPGSSRAVSVEGMQVCHAQRLRQLIADVALSGGGQPVFFTLELTAVGTGSGSDQTSPTFPFAVRVCAGCLQPFYPAVPACADAPKPNPARGNPCNIAQDGPEVLCCTDPGGALICPAPDA